ncbi:glycosyltransferase [Fusobacterium hominis]|uniref:Glycosyltransferase n=1 Tax=Fusobacterium hominis TaxID=2764326 RepID=A0A7G9GUI8_9FUSO|nr:glycosyltransferase [Fusobacterium hominis]QNM14470.1 glycosyltransferase [Fusobacterium hominis]
MKISVIIPVYNRMEHLRALFICLINQKRKPDEVIIADDGSSQKIYDFIGDLFDKCNFTIKHVYQVDKGFRKTRSINNAVRISSGELLIFCDQDLIFGDDYIDTIYKNIKENIFLMGRAYCLSEDKKNYILEKLEYENYDNIVKDIIPAEYKMTIDKMLKRDKLRRILYEIGINKRGIKLVGMSVAILKKSFIKVNGYDELYIGWGNEDDDLGNRLHAAGIKGKELKTAKLQMHLWHYSDPTKKGKQNEDYYNKRKNEIFNEKKFYCEFGLNKTKDDDNVIVSVVSKND